jgi:membrane-associated phospholipid phosphatase
MNGFLATLYRRFEIPILTLFVAGVIFPMYILINYLSVGRDYSLLTTSIDRSIPFTPGWIYIYALIYVMALSPLTVVKDRAYFRRIALMYTAVIMTGNIIFLMFPVMMIRMVIPVRDFLSWGLALNNYLDPPYNCFPSMHVGNAFSASFALYHLYPPLGVINIVLSILICLSTLMVKQHYLLDVIAGMLISYFYYRVIVKPYPIKRFDRAQLMRRPGWYGLVPLIYILAVGLLYLSYHLGVTFPKPIWETAATVIYRQG